eukprot:2075496-Amphidinium_carterae.2
MDLHCWISFCIVGGFAPLSSLGLEATEGEVAQLDDLVHGARKEIDPQSCKVKSAPGVERFVASVDPSGFANVRRKTQTALRFLVRHSY